MGGLSPVSENAVVWHDVECGSYEADLATWLDLADRAESVLEIGAGTGRVSLHLADQGCDVTALDPQPELVRAMAARARERGLRIRAHVGDARSFDMQRSFDLAIAPMQVVQLMGGERARRLMLERVRAHLERGALFAAALADPFEGIPSLGLSPGGTPLGIDAAPPMPDMRQEEGWVYSSTPVAVRPVKGATEIDRLRQSVSPEGELAESLTTLRLDRVLPEDLERPGQELGYRTAGRREVPPTTEYVGSTVVLLEAV
jgi:SAM-dependent methyltransferase